MLGDNDDCDGTKSSTNDIKDRYRQYLEINGSSKTCTLAPRRESSHGQDA